MLQTRYCDAYAICIAACARAAVGAVAGPRLGRCIDASITQTLPVPHNSSAAAMPNAVSGVSPNGAHTPLQVAPRAISAKLAATATAGLAAPICTRQRHTLNAAPPTSKTVASTRSPLRCESGACTSIAANRIQPGMSAPQPIVRHTRSRSQAASSSNAKRAAPALKASAASAPNSDAVIAVSKETRADIARLFNIRDERLHVIYNGIDLDEYRPVKSKDVLRKFGIDSEKPYLLFVGRITRQKGIIHLVRAIEFMDKNFQVVLCAGAPDTPEIAREMKRAVEQARRARDGIIWIDQMLDKPSVIQFYSHAAVFCCPSIYEPFGIINLEAMACETAVVASKVGGIKEVVVDGETGFLVPLAQMKESPFEPIHPAKFERDLAAKINELMRDEKLRERFGKAGRLRAEKKFSWRAIARETKSLYQSLVAKKAAA